MRCRRRSRQLCRLVADPGETQRRQGPNRSTTSPTTIAINRTTETMTIKKILDWAQKNDRIRDGLVLCELCDNPALKSGALRMSWVGCGACYFGEADMLDPDDVISLGRVSDPASM